MRRHLGWRVLLVVLVVAGAGVLAVVREPRLGLDLRGGTQIVLEAEAGGQRPVTADTVDRTVEVLRRRVDQLGVAEPSLQRSGERRIIVELPGVYDPAEAVRVIGRTAQLAFHPVLAVPDPPGGGAGAPTTTTQPPAQAPAGELVLPDEDGVGIRLGAAALTGEAVGDARAELDPQAGGRWQVVVDFRGDGGQRWAALTGEAACQPAGDPRRRVAIVLDGQVLSSPQVDPAVACEQGITGGSTVITGSFSDREAKDLGLLIRAGALPVPVQVVEQRTVGATLGDRAISASTQAALLGVLATLVYMVVAYRLLGGLAGVALGVYGLVSYAVLLALGATLTLPGIAGFVLAIGMAVDANVLVFERMRDEHTEGRRLRGVAELGFRRAWSAIADSNVTTLLAAVLLFFLASGAVRGFGVTLSVGVVVSMFTALVVTRVLVDLTVGVRAVASRPWLLGLGSGGRLRGWLAARQPDLLGRSRWWFGVSLLLLVLAGVGLVGRGLNFGVEFTGGRLLEYDTPAAPAVDATRAALAAAGLPRAVVQTTGGGHLAVRTGQLDPAAERRVQQAVTGVNGAAVEVRDEFIGPSIGTELRRKALLALGVALVVQLGYMAVRFRWTFGTAAVAAMAHDVVILLGVFAWLGKPVDGVFVAALLTVIGYSVNDSVVVFDRIRERLRTRRREPLAALANQACLATLPRTVNTGMGALFILAALYVLGGDTLTDFALALLVGIVVGTYSSVCTAAPLAVALEQRTERPPATPPAPRAGRAADRQPAAVAAAAAPEPPQATTPTAASDAAERAQRPAGPTPTRQPQRKRPAAGRARRTRRR